MNDNRQLQKIFQAYYPAYEKSHPQPLKHQKAAQALIHCRTAAQGYSSYRCTQDHSEKDIYHACRHRSCPVCASRKQHQWLQQQCERILPCRHYHVVFTIPHEYRVLWQYNTGWFTQALFQSSQQTLFELLADNKYLGATPGLFMSLHSWGRQLNLHPHVHGLITAGGVTQTGDWKALNQEFLLPIRVIKALYRGKFQSRLKTALEAGELKLPPDKTLPEMKQMIRQLYRKAWSVRVQPPYEHGHGVLNYLSRYITGGPLKAGQIIGADAQAVSFCYQSHQTGRLESMRLSKEEFMRRMLLHVPEPGMHTIRYYGLYAGANKTRERIREQWREKEQTEKKVARQLSHSIKCEHCGTEMKLVFSVYPNRGKGNSYIKESKREDRTAFVQPDVQADVVTVMPP